MNQHSILKSFSELSNQELYQILNLRNEVFIIEQNCIYPDTDFKDQHCHHLMFFKELKLVAYARLVPAGISFDEVSIGRVITHSSARGTGLGKILMRKAMDECRLIYGNVPIRIGAQCYAKAFYNTLGFEESGEEYLEDGIPHIEMLAAAH
ncbi:GNAT family N-acetyltransferase [Pedobacter sp. AW1-32]|uniref:GNAT family N-acetyltransferase n=1 Tax=Pedobacter sp. AW1-32 TaxID=3383026 RepID=UPI003FF05DEB